ncbi:hypothetical protein N9770_05465 [Amylibacter sp.]|nr:hypothetical protein [Amylibacter sp.]
MSYNIPIYFHIFNRKELTSAVFEQIRNIKPKKLYVTADGPRDSVTTDISKCLEVRKIIDTIDWECDLKTQFFDRNYGSYLSYINGLNWLFSNESEAVLLEDDDLPHPDFFHFCEYNLNKYRYDNRVFSISGNNFDRNNLYDESFFSRMPSCWGWATWSRTWNNLDLEYSLASQLENKIYSKSVYANYFEEKYYNSYFKSRASGEFKSNWDYMLIYNALIKGQLTIVPPINLVKNIGFGADATNTSHDDPFKLSLPTASKSFNFEDINPIFAYNHEYDTYVSSIAGSRGLRGYLSRYKKSLLTKLFK